ncbi:MAG: helix-turn-helix domain-containing protein [Planctomycetota bacterium]|jgi:transposase
MTNRRTIFDIHRLAQQGFSVRKIATSLGISRQTVQKYLDDPNPQRPTFTRPGKLDPFKDDIKRMLETDPKASAMVIRQHLEAQGFEGGITILREYLNRVRPSAKPRQAFIRFESKPGEQCQIDWGLCRARHRPHYADIRTMPSLIGFRKRARS